MASAIGAFLSFAGPILMGWLLVRALWPESSWEIRFPTGAALGLGMTGAAYYLALSITKSTYRSFVVSEVALGGTILLLIVMKLLSRKQSQMPTSPDEPFKIDVNPVLTLTFLLAAVLTGIAAVFAMDELPHGEWDAVAIWNLKARFIFRGTTDPIARLADPALFDTHGDYPLLLPMLVARGWQYMGHESLIIPIGIAVIFSVATIMVTVNGLKLLAKAPQAMVAGCLLLGTPFFVRHGFSQYADILVSCFFTSAVVLLSIHDSLHVSNGKLPLLAGISAGLAVSTKNEGLLFFLVLIAVRFWLRLWRKSSQQGVREIAHLAIGASLGVIALTVFKSLYSPPNSILVGFTPTLALQRFLDFNYQGQLFKGLAEKTVVFGEWWIAPLLLLLVHIVVTRFRASHKAGHWSTVALVLAGMMCGYYAVYLITPYPLQWHIDSSFTRLLLQIWPLALVLHGTLTKSGPDG